jgi:hypothetical protein
VKLLITARDVAAALHLIEVAKAASRDRRFEIVVAAQPPAAAHFADAGVEARVVDAPHATTATSGEAVALRRIARALLDEIRPDAVLAGLSTPFDAGLDEAVLAEATVPTILYQDFWGEQNLLLGRGADVILALDGEAAARNAARFNQRSEIVGSAKHSAFVEFDIPTARARGRASIGVRDDDPVVGFFGQALHSLPGYLRTVARLAAVLPTLSRPVTVLLRPHPREDAAQRQMTEQLFADAAVPVHLRADGTIQDALVTCDVVVSVFSTCTFDTAYLNRYAAAPVAVPVSLLFDPEIATYCQQHGNYLEFQHHTLGIVKPVYAAADLTATLDDCIRAETKRDVWERAHAYLPDPADAPERVLSVVAACVATRTTRR